MKPKAVRQKAVFKITKSLKSVILFIISVVAVGIFKLQYYLQILLTLNISKRSIILYFNRSKYQSKYGPILTINKSLWRYILPTIKIMKSNVGIVYYISLLYHIMQTSKKTCFIPEILKLKSFLLSNSKYAIMAEE